MTTTYTSTLSPEEYLVRERAAEYRSEYLAGEVRAMTGASRKHNRIAMNLGALLHGRLRGGPCEPFMSDMRVKVERTGAYFYPDVVVACGASRLEDEHQDTLLNPVVIVEVLSPSTADYDHAAKWEHYRRIPALMDYLLLSQSEPRVERYTRQAEGLWLFSETSGLDADLRLDSIGCTLALRDVYERVL
ncbi:MAG: Uma2 family endonuclease [Longimicrobiaceae bacterium]